MNIIYFDDDLQPESRQKHASEVRQSDLRPERREHADVQSTRSFLYRDGELWMIKNRNGALPTTPVDLQEVLKVWPDSLAAASGR
jgi:hypothetical protein